LRTRWVWPFPHSEPPRQRRWLACVWIFLAGCSALDAQAQGNTNAAAASQSNLRTASLPRSNSIVEARRSASNGSQIRVTVQYLMVDTDTRRQIYSGLDPEAIESVLQVPAEAERSELDGTVQPASTVTKIHSPSRVTTYTLDPTEFAQVMGCAINSKQCDINVAPKIILLDGNDVEMTDLVQRPFVIGFQRQGAQDQVEPHVHVLDEGTRLRLLAKQNPSSATGSVESIDLQCELTVFNVLQVDTDEVFGLQQEPMTVQVPIQSITSALASAELSAGQTLMIDPHITSSKQIEQEQGIPVLNKIPYVGRTFRNVGRATLQQHLVLLLQPSIEPISNP
jgi:hypothetical protein